MTGRLSKGELYARLKTWHLLTSKSGLISNTTSIADRGLELHERNFPMFRRYEIQLRENKIFND